MAEWSVQCWVVCTRPLLITLCICIIWKALYPYVSDAQLGLWVSLEHTFTCVFTTNQAEWRSSATHLLVRWEHERTTAWCSCAQSGGPSVIPTAGILKNSEIICVWVWEREAVWRTEIIPAYFYRCRVDVWVGFVWNGLWVLELAAVGDSRVTIEGDVKLELTSFRPHDSRFAANCDTIFILRLMDDRCGRSRWP